MPIVQDQVSGRIDNYRVSIYDTDDFSRSTLGVELLLPVKIRYGDLKRSPSKSILKSYTQLTFVDEELKLLEEFQGGFKTERYVVEIYSINTPDVKWRGLVKEKSRIKPFSTRTSKDTTTLNCYGGIEEGRISEEKAKQKHGSSPSDVFMPEQGAYMLSRFTKQAHIESIENNGDFDGGEYIRSNVQLKSEETQNWYNVGDVYDFDIPQNDFRLFPTPINLVQFDSFWEASKEFNSVYKHMIYRSLSEGRIVWEDKLKLGASSQFDTKATQNWPTQDDYVMESRDAHINTVNTEDIIEERDTDGLRDLKSFGNIVIRFDKEDNVSHIGPVTRNLLNSNRDFDIDIRYSNEDFGTAEQIVKKGKPFVLVQNVNTDHAGTATLKLDEITPRDKLGLVVSWQSDFLRNVDYVKIIYNDGNGTSVTENNPSDNTRLTGPLVDVQFQPEVEVKLQKAQGSPTESSVIALKVRWLSSNGTVAEKLIAGGSEKGIEPVEIEDPLDPLLTRYQNEDNTDTLFDFVGFREAQEQRDVDPPRSINVKSSGFFQLKNESLIRPSDTKTARFKTKGIFGPEYLHKIENSEGNFSYYIASGLEINLANGMTDCSLTEVPNHFLS